MDTPPDSNKLTLPTEEQTEDAEKVMNVQQRIMGEIRYGNLEGLTPADVEVLKKIQDFRYSQAADGDTLLLELDGHKIKIQRNKDPDNEHREYYVTRVDDVSIDSEDSSKKMFDKFKRFYDILKLDEGVHRFEDSLMVVETPGGYAAQAFEKIRYDDALNNEREEEKKVQKERKEKARAYVDTLLG